MKRIDPRMASNRNYIKALEVLHSLQCTFFNDRTEKGRSIKLDLYGDTDAAEKKLAKLADKVTKSPDYMKSSGRLGLADYKQEGAKRFHFYAKGESK